MIFGIPVEKVLFEKFIGLHHKYNFIQNILRDFTEKIVNIKSTKMELILLFLSIMIFTPFNGHTLDY